MKDLINELRQDKQKLIGVIIGFGVVCVLDCAFVVKAQLRQTGQLGAQVIKLKKDIETVSKELVWMRPGLSAPAAKLNDSYQMYTEGEIPFLMDAISLHAKENNIKIMQIIPIKELKPKDKKEKQPPGDVFMGLRLKLNLNARYHKLGTFINAMEKSEHPVFVEEIKIVRSADDYMKLNVNLILKTYVKK